LSVPLPCTREQRQQRFRADIRRATPHDQWSTRLTIETEEPSAEAASRYGVVYNTKMRTSEVPMEQHPGIVLEADGIQHEQ
jgi:hypothetical protein